VTAIIAQTPEETEQLGRTIAAELAAGDLVALNGELGAGKTTLTRGIGEALGVRGTVSSPTFVLARTHERNGAPPLVHVDAYRLSAPIELDDLDIDFENSIVVVEWASGMIDGIADSWLAIDIERPRGSTALESEAEPRVITVKGYGPRWADLGWLSAGA
jgi:tRNA threonylcarbamoyladenosine biosynthesis protein TsaE